MLRTFSVAPFVIVAALGPFSVAAAELLEIDFIAGGAKGINKISSAISYQFGTASEPAATPPVTPVTPAATPPATPASPST